MKQILLLIISLIIPTGCGPRLKNNQAMVIKKDSMIIVDNNPDTVKSNIAKTSVSISKIVKDSIYRAGKRILDGQTIWGRNEEYLFPLMDSLMTKDTITRLFYFKVFSKICAQSDGYVSEVIGEHVLKYFRLDPSQFIRYSKYIDSTIFKSMGHEVGVEIKLSNDTLSDKVFRNLMSSSKSRTVNLNDSDKLKLNDFFNQIKKGLELNLRDN